MVIAHSRRQAPEDLLVRQRLARRLHDLHLSRQKKMEIGRNQIVELQKARRREHQIGQLGGVGLEEVDDHGEKILARQRPAQALLIRSGGRHVHVPAEEGLGPRRVFQHLRKVHVTDRGRGIDRQAGRRFDIVLIEAKRPSAVEIVDPRPGLADVPGDRRQQACGAHDVATPRLALQTLPQPQERGATAIDLRHLLDHRRGHARDRLAPCRRTGLDRRRQLLPAQAVSGEEVLVGQALGANRV